MKESFTEEEVRVLKEFAKERLLIEECFLKDKYGKPIPYRNRYSKQPPYLNKKASHNKACKN